MRRRLRRLKVSFKGGGIPIPAAGLQAERVFSFHSLFLPLAIVFSLHMIAVFLTVFSPMQLFRRPQHIDFYAVNLFRVTDITAPPAITTPQPPSAPPQVQPQPQVETVPQPKKIETPPTTSLSPQRVRKKPVDSKAEKIKRDELINKKMVAMKAELAAKAAKQDAKEAAREAVSKISELYQKQHATAPPAGPPGSGQQSMALSDIQKAYLASVHSRILKNWILPDLQNWDKDLEAVIVIKFDKSGTILKHFFEKKSNNQYFDKFVEKAIQESNPLPPFPAAFTETQMELGFRFRPGELL